MRRRLLHGGLAILIVAGTAAAVARATFPADLGRRMDPYRERLFRWLALVDPHQPERAAEMARVDARFAAHPRPTMLHVIPGGLFLLLAPLQFASGVRARHPALHRWTGRLLLAMAATFGMTGLFFGLLLPYAGLAESLAIAVFGGMFVLALGRGFQAIRRGDVARHREWMVRAFALAIGVSTVRVLGTALDVTLSPIGVGPQVVFLLAVWSGWTVSLGTAELWIRRTRA